MANYGQPLAPVPFAIVEKDVLTTYADSGTEHIHLLILTKEYGLCFVCSIDGEWMVSPVDMDNAPVIFPDTDDTE